jgi:hypothetical protein
MPTWSRAAAVGVRTRKPTDPKEELVAILMTQCMGFPSGLYPDCWTLVYQAIDD